jgi:serine protease Do
VATRVRVAFVEEDDDAAKAGLKRGDVLVSYGGSPVTTTAEFESQRNSAAGDKPRPLVVERGGKQYTLQLKPDDLDLELENYLPVPSVQ